MQELLYRVWPHIYSLLYLVPAVAISLTVHEFCHAYAATKLGDPTPRQEGRLSLNPLRHIDIFGFVVMLIIHFGWAKPVQVKLQLDVLLSVLTH